MIMMVLKTLKRNKAAFVSFLKKFTFTSLIITFYLVVWLFTWQGTPR